MATGDSERQGGESFRDQWMSLPPDIQPLLPEENIGRYESTNAMHCGPGVGGSKFTDERVKSIFDVVAMRPDLANRVRERADDRKALEAAGASETAFLPATKGPDAPAGQPEALYFKVENVEGRLGIIQVKELAPGTRVIVRREKGKSNPAEKGYAPASITVILGSAEDMPKTDFATIIVGRSGGDQGSNEVWTVHPGAPIRAATREISGAERLLSPEETPSGEKQAALVMTIEDAMKAVNLSPEDYVKIVPGDLDETLKAYDVK